MREEKVLLLVFSCFRFKFLTIQHKGGKELEFREYVEPIHPRSCSGPGCPGCPCWSSLSVPVLVAAKSMCSMCVLFFLVC